MQILMVTMDTPQWRLPNQFDHCKLQYGGRVRPFVACSAALGAFPVAWGPVAQNTDTPHVWQQPLLCDEENSRGTRPEGQWGKWPSVTWNQCNLFLLKGVSGISELAFQNACFLFVVLWAIQEGGFHSDSLEIISLVLLPPDEIRSFLYVAILPIHESTC